MAHPTIHIGSTGPEVKLAQDALAKRGYSPGPLDGLFGPLVRMNGDVAAFIDAEVALAPVANLINLQGVLYFPGIH